MKNKVIGICSIFIGIAVTGSWVLILSSGEVEEGQTEITFHLISEFIMAIFCFVSGILILKKHPLGNILNIIGLSMILYSVLNDAGYYGERNELAFTVLFILLFLVSGIALAVQLWEFKRDLNQSRFYSS